MYISSLRFYYPICSSGGIFGDLRVFYTVQELDLVEQATRSGQTVFDYFLAPLVGKPLPLTGTTWNVATQPDPLRVKM